MPPVGRARRGLSDYAAEAALVLVALLLIFAAGAAGFIVGRGSAEDGGGGGTAAAETTAGETEGATGETQTGETQTGETGETQTGETGGETETGGGGGGGDAAAGEQVFAEAGCGSCHTLQAAGASGTVGPSLDETQLGQDEIAQVVTNGRGAMPAFGDRLSEDEINAVAAYVAENAGG
jgi:cytochrome c5